jgi:hypothetical protein
MKISKKRLLEIIMEECGMANSAPGMLPNGEIDDEGRMAKQQLADIAEYASELSGMLSNETQLEAWVQDKLSKAADYIKTVKHYVEYGMEEGAYGQNMPEMTPQMTEIVPVVGEIGEFPLENSEIESEEDDLYEF